MTNDDIIAELKDLFANVPRPGVPVDYIPDGKLGNPGWDEFTYHSALVFAEQVPDHVRRAFDSPDDQVPELLWHLSDSERLGVFSNRQIAALARVLDVIEAEHPAVTGDPKVEPRLQAVRRTLERLAGRSE
jgi:hypothetical protein